MSRLMIILGIVFLALGAAIAVVGFARPGQMQVSGLTMDSAGLLLMTGLLGLGFGGLIDAIQNRGGSVAVAMPETTAATEKVETITPISDGPTPAAAVEEEQPARIRFRGFGRSAATETTGAAATATAVESTKSSVDDTINALEKAKQDITTALGGVERISTTTSSAVSDPVAGEEDAAAGDDAELYVVEEKMIRGRPARILSDETVEAETDEGWMRFENLEHLNEYLDAAEA